MSSAPPHKDAFPPSEWMLNMKYNTQSVVAMSLSICWTNLAEQGDWLLLP